MEKTNAKVNYDLLTDTALKECGSLLLHCCCGPCATAVVERILPFVRPTLYYYNPNTQPKDEYEKRLVELKKVADEYGLEVIVEPYDDGEFLSAVKGYENEKEGGTRCPVCFELRLTRTAKKAKKEGYDFFATTLTVSPHKNAQIINAIGERIASEQGVKWLPSDWKKRNGYRRSVELSSALSLYRQDWCGCDFSRRAYDD
ncbi:MAG: epoxyqueuosine reductase QueH [Clostridia bacterium]|nr:epoxyqueuosine reductase QueH [Clostridia bacterium]